MSSFMEHIHREPKRLTIDITAWGETQTCWVEVGTYANGRVAISLGYDDPECGPAPYGKVTVNLPDVHLNDGEVLVKDWAENEPVAQALLDAGWLERTGREVASGHVFPLVARPAGALKEFLAPSLRLTRWPRFAPSPTATPTRRTHDHHQHT